MSKLTFYKYQGAGNDFIILDNRSGSVQLSTEQIEHLCHRRWGIGADGLMMIERDEHEDFRMVYYNADGRESTMCGNGGRCILLAARNLGVTGDAATFTAIDGIHEGQILEDGLVRLGMIDVETIGSFRGYNVINTGSPHIIIPVDGLREFDVYNEGRSMRYDTEFLPDGINVNFVEKSGDAIYIRTYERGVEEETWACGTGVTAAAISSAANTPGAYSIPVKARGGALVVTFVIGPDLKVTDVFLTGPAEYVFSGEIDTDSLGLEKKG